MTFWILIALLTLAVALAVLIPLQRQQAVQEAHASDVEVFKAQLKEIDADLESGALDADLAEAARIEVSRRLLAAHKAAKQIKTGGSHKLRTRASSLLVVLVMPLAALALYLSYGSPDLPDDPYEQRLARMNQNQASIKEMIAQTEAHLANNPDDGRGWQVLAPIYMRSGEYTKAAKAFQQAIRTMGDLPDLKMGLAEALIFEADGKVNDVAFALLQDLEKVAPDAVKPRFYIAVALGQQGKRQQAIALWQKLIAQAEPDASWLPIANSYLADLQNEEKPTEKEKTKNVDDAQSTAAQKEPLLKNPDAETVRAASEMSATDRQQMITQMVDQLKTRLYTDGGSLAEWQRLIRSQIILDDTAEAQNALCKAIAAFKENADANKTLELLASKMGVSPSSDCKK
ncbi:c-type cytochrome biogenesis protein CcmI [Polycladidibacter stylochi]|uniref:c-type cytochrome biogenesis protein CcmI n=1 Tax=Polycladidibacter stylochi TaxID=1807766 RepID=UPI000829BCC8|nr:c-type cytochrome biogenesis protein CcmI [Pseudovibrio stylochi]